ncbi:MAG: FG-GAP-like repeat-containing protein [Isosphaeraceae bacterium]
MVAILALAVVAAGLRAWRHDAAFRLAKADLEARRFREALPALEALDASRPVWVFDAPGAFEFALGHARWMANRREAAIKALARVPEDSPNATRADVLLAEFDLERGRWRAAEDRLVRALARGGEGLLDVRSQLDKLYRMQVRFDDAAQVLRDGWRDSNDPVKTLKALWTTDRGTPPYDAIGQAIETAAALEPEDDRVWLARARLATQTGGLDEARAWLSKCEARRFDEAVARAWLDWAKAADRPDEVVRALRALETERLTTRERHAWRAWFARRKGDADAERSALASLLDLEPRNPRWLNRGAELAIEAGDLDAATALRLRKARVDEAIDAYSRTMASGRTLSTASERIEAGRLAELAGRRPDALAWYALALLIDPNDDQARRALAELNADETRLRVERTDDVPPWIRSDAKVAANGAPPPAKIQFQDAARDSGLSHVFRNGETAIRQMPVALGGGVGLIDYDRDGFLDVYAIQGGPFPPEPGAKSAGDRLFRNQGNGTFVDVTERAGLPPTSRGYGQGVSVGDVDGDGDPDLFVTRWRSYALYLNRGDGTFEDVTESWDLGGDRDWPTSSALADFDRDGDLDLYVCHYVVWDEVDPRLCRDASTGAYMSCDPTTCAPRPDHVFRNDGGRFVDVSEEAGIHAVDAHGRGLGVVASDFDGDGEIDLFIANDKSANFLFRNLGGFRFEEVAHARGAAGNAQGGYQAGMGIASADLDGDGLPDVAVTNYYGESTSFYRNLGDGSFTDQTTASGLGAASRLRLGFGIAILDVDDDGLPDLLTANGHTDDLGDAPYRMPAQLLRNVGKGRLIDVTLGAGEALNSPRLGRGLAAGDLDNDGRVDALLVDQNAPMVYLRNQTSSAGRWVSFRLEGRESNRDGVGTVIAIDAGGRRQVARRSGGGSYLSAGDPRIHFGLGPIDRVESVEVRWPSGRVDHFRDLEAGHVYHLIEGADELGNDLASP